jgi:hypothetical protein
VERTNARTTFRVMTLTVLAAGALAGCGGGSAAPKATAAATTGPTTAPSIDDSSGTIVPPAGDPAGTSAGTAPTAPHAAATSPLSDSGPSVGSDDGTTPTTSVPGHTMPGLADGAVALPSSVTVADDGRCRVGALRLQPLDLQGSPGGTYADFRLVNVSASTCAVRGYVGARLIGGSGQDLITSVRHEDGPDVWVRVAPKGSAQFHLRFPNPFSGSAPCNAPNAAKVRISLASTSGTLTGATPEGGIQACNGEVSTAPVGST